MRAPVAAATKQGIALAVMRRTTVTRECAAVPVLGYARHVEGETAAHVKRLARFFRIRKSWLGAWRAARQRDQALLEVPAPISK